MSRRAAIKRVALLAGGALLLPDILKAWENPDIQNTAFRLSFAEEETLAELCETIVPSTDTPGAKAAGVPAFLKKLLADCYTEKDRTDFMDGLSRLETDAQTRFGRSFAAGTPEQRIELLKSVAASKSRFWVLAKQIIVWGYLSSEIGCTQVLRYEPIPGRYDGDYPYKKGDRAWAG